MAAARSRVAFVRRWSLRLLWSVALVFATIVIGGALDATRRLPDLQPWHRIVPPDAGIRTLTNSSTLADYLAIEERAFRTVRERIEDTLDPAWKLPANRYNREGLSHPSRFGADWNRTQILVPEGEPVGGALLVHGLTDSPYSLRTIGQDLRARGYYVVVLRVPGHGTVPAGLIDVTWEDWLAAVRVAAREVRRRIGTGTPLLLVGYSNGGALVLKYALDVAEGSGDPQAHRLVLLSPMIGVTRFAWLARVISLLGVLPAFEKAHWLDVYPEYNPFKYNSFPANAGLQTWRLTRTMQSQIARLAAAGRAGELPPMLTFHSLVDATVSTPALVQALYDVVADERSELVLFDVNRSSGLVPFIRPADAALVAQLANETPRKYRRTLITNADPSSLDVVERTAAPGSRTVVTRPLGLSWPRDVYSLSHVAIPFPMSDPVYGREEIEPQPGTIRLGLLSPRGERAVLTVPSDVLMRLTCNPFYSYLEDRMAGWIPRGSRAAGPAVR
jgi:alpha-beta hydrolase superfamily lysophospholipase